MANESTLTIRIGGDTADLQKKLVQITSEVKKVAGNFGLATEGITSSLGNAGRSAGLFGKSLGDLSLGSLGLGFGLKELGSIAIGVFKDSVSAATNFENSMVGLNSVAKNLAINTDDLESVLVDMTKDGLVPVTDAAQSLKTLMASGLGLQESVKLFNALKDSAAFNRQGQLSMGEAIVGATQGIKNQNSIMVDNAGITKNLSILWKEYATSIGKTADKLTDAEKAQAAYVGILKEAQVFQGDADKLTKTYSGSVAGLGAAWNKLLVSMGKFVTESGLLQRNISALANTLDRLAKPDDDSEKGRLAKLKERLDLLKKSGSSAYGEMASLEGIINRLEKSLNERAASANSLRGNDLTDELIQNGKNKARVAIVTKKVNEEIAREENERRLSSIKKQKEAYDNLLKKYTDYNADKYQELINAENRELKIAGKNEELKLKIKENYGEKIRSLQEKQADEFIKLELEKIKEIEEEEKKAEERKRKREELVSKSAANPVRALLDVGTGQVKDGDKRDTLLGSAAGLGANIANGASGAKTLISSVAAEGLAVALGNPALAKAFEPLIAGLTGGPEATREFVKSFTDAIPGLIEGLILAIPVLIEELANQFPVVIERLVERAPDVIKAFVEEMPTMINALALQMPKIGLALAKEMPNVALSFIDGLINGAGDFVQALIDSITGGGGGIFGGGGSGLLAGSGIPIVEDIGGFLGLASGGTPFAKTVPAGFGNDSFPARLTSGELVVDQGTSSGLRDFINGKGENAEKLNTIINLLNGPMKINTSVNLNNRTFADIILELNRTNQRLA